MKPNKLSPKQKFFSYLAQMYFLLTKIDFLCVVFLQNCTLKRQFFRKYRWNKTEFLKVETITPLQHLTNV